MTFQAQQQGDVKLFQTINDGNINVEDGITEMSGGLETAAYLCLFGGNEDDSGSDGNNLQYWGNFDETDVDFMYRSETQFALQQLPAIPASLNSLRDAALRDLSMFTTQKIANEVGVIVSMPGVNKVNFKVTINAFGELSEFNFTENWQATQSEFEDYEQTLTSFVYQWLASRASTTPVVVASPGNGNPAPYIVDPMSGVDAYQATVADQGILVTSGLNGLPQIDMDTTDLYGFAPSPLAIAQPFALMHVAKVTAPASDKILFGDANLNYGWGSDGRPFITDGITKVKAQPRQIPASDNFNDPTVDFERWTLDVANGTIVQAGGKMTQTVTVAGVKSVRADNNESPLTGDFDRSVDVNILGTRPSSPNTNLAFLRLSSAPDFIVGGGWSGSGVEHQKFVAINGVEVVQFTDLGAAVTSLRMKRVSGVITAYVNGVAQWSGVDTSTLSDVALQTISVNEPANTSIEYDNFLAEDSPGVPSYIDLPWTDAAHIFTPVFDGANSYIRVDNAHENTGDMGTAAIASAKIKEAGLVQELSEIRGYDEFNDSVRNAEYNSLKNTYDL